MRAQDQQRPGTKLLASSHRQKTSPQSKTRRIPFLLGLATASIFGGAAHAAVEGGGTWINNLGGTWQTGTNWSTSLPPGSADSVYFTLPGTYTIDFSSGAAALNINQSAGSVTLSLNGNSLIAPSGNLQIGYATGQSGSLTLLNGSLTLGGSGVSGVGRGTGATGFLGIDAATLTLQNSSEFDVGDLGSGTLLIQNAGKLLSNATVVAGYHGANGWIQVQGANSLLSSNGFIDVGDGGGGGNGTLLVQNAGQASAASAVIIGFRSGNGWATVSGANSLLRSTGSILDIGDGGSGTLLVQNSGQARSDSSLLYAGYSTGGIGNVSVTSGGSLSSAGAVIGAAGGIGTVSLTGAGSAWSNSANLNLGNDGSNAPAANGTGTLALANGAAMSVAGSIRLYNGQITIDSSTVAHTGGAVSEFAIGDRGVGTFTAQNGAVVNTNSNVIIGYHSGTGRATVSGANSAINGTGSGILDIGDGATGTLSIQNGGFVGTGGNAYVGFSGGTGFIGVSGANSRLNVAGTLSLYTAGTLSLSNGGRVTVGGLNLNGNVSNFIWTGGTLNVNGSAPNSDGALTVPSTATLGGVGSIDRPTTISPGATLAPGESAGKLTFTQNLTLQSSIPTRATFEVELGGNPNLTENAGLTFDQVVVAGSGRVFTVGGATLRVLPLTNVSLNQPYQIVKVTGGATVNYSSVFSNLAGGTHFADSFVAYTVSYDTGSGIYVTFTAVPEPSVLALAIVTPLLMRRRNPRRSNKDLNSTPTRASLTV